MLRLHIREAWYIASPWKLRVTVGLLRLNLNPAAVLLWAQLLPCLQHTCLGNTRNPKPQTPKPSTRNPKKGSWAQVDSFLYPGYIFWGIADKIEAGAWFRPLCSCPHSFSHSSFLPSLLPSFLQRISLSLSLTYVKG